MAFEIDKHKEQSDKALHLLIGNNDLLVSLVHEDGFHGKIYNALRKLTEMSKGKHGCNHNLNNLFAEVKDDYILINYYLGNSKIIETMYINPTAQIVCFYSNENLTSNNESLYNISAYGIKENEIRSFHLCEEIFTKHDDIEQNKIVHLVHSKFKSLNTENIKTFQLTNKKDIVIK